jgi:hypothetical protein
MLKRVATRCEVRDIRGFQVYVMDGWAYLLRGESVIRLDWFEFRAAVRYLERRAGRKVVAA